MENREAQLRQEALEELKANAEYEFKNKIKDKLKAIAVTQGEISALAIKLGKQKEELKALSLDIPSYE